MRLAVLVLLAACAAEAEPCDKPWTPDQRCLEPCKTVGWCQYLDGQCVALTMRDCAASLMCGQYYDCEVYDGRCHVTACKGCPDAVP